MRGSSARPLKVSKNNEVPLSARGVTRAPINDLKDQYITSAKVILKEAPTLPLPIVSN
jgi:hypothetical protein